MKSVGLIRAGLLSEGFCPWLEEGAPRGSIECRVTGCRRNCCLGKKWEKQGKKKGHKDFYRNGDAGCLWAGWGVVFSYCSMVSTVSFINRKHNTKNQELECGGPSAHEFPRLREDFRGAGAGGPPQFPTLPWREVSLSAAAVALKRPPQPEFKAGR